MNRHASAREAPDLTTARRLIERLGGKLWVDGRGSTGVTIHFTLRSGRD